MNQIRVPFSLVTALLGLLFLSIFPAQVFANPLVCPAVFESDNISTGTITYRSTQVNVRTDPFSSPRCEVGSYSQNATTHGARAAIRITPGPPSEVVVFAYFYDGIVNAPDTSVSLSCVGGTDYLGLSHIDEIPENTDTNCTATYANPTRSDTFTFSVRGEFVSIPGFTRYERTIGIQTLTSIDLQPLTATLSGFSGQMNGPVTVTTTFSTEIDASSFTLADFNTTGLTLSNLSTGNPPTPADFPQSYTFTATPTAATVSLSLPANAVSGYTGSDNLASNILSGTYDNIAPVITPPANISQDTDPGLATASVTFSASVSDNLGEVIAPIFTIGPTLISSPYVFPLGTTTVTINAADSFGNDATEVSFDVTITDNEAPTVAITGLPPGFSGTPDLDMTITFSEDVSGFDASDLLITNATVLPLTGGPAVYTGTIQPTGTGDISVSVPQDAATDGAGNGNNASTSVLLTIDSSCGTSNGGTFTSAPVSNLCLAGNASTVSGAGPWSWDCTSNSGGATASCSADIQSYAITTAGSPGEGGVISCTPNPVDHGGSSSCTATANNGFRFEYFSGACIGETCVLNNVTGTQNVTANFSFLLSAVGIPTLSIWALFALAGLLGGLGVGRMRKN